MTVLFWQVRTYLSCYPFKTDAGIFIDQQHNNFNWADFISSSSSENTPVSDIKLVSWDYSIICTLWVRVVTQWPNYQLQFVFIYTFLSWNGSLTSMCPWNCIGMDTTYTIMLLCRRSLLITHFGCTLFITFPLAVKLLPKACPHYQACPTGTWRWRYCLLLFNRGMYRTAAPSLFQIFGE